jgi:hypothetical protein
VCLDQVGLLVGLRVLLRLAQFLDQAHGAALEAAVESATGAGVQDVEELIGGDVEESVWQEGYVSILFCWFVPFCAI